MKSYLLLGLILATQSAFADSVRIECRGEGPDLDTARADADRICINSVMNRLDSEISVQQNSLETEKEINFHSEIVRHGSYEGLTCKPEGEKIEVLPTQTVVHFTCAYDISKAKRITKPYDRIIKPYDSQPTATKVELPSAMPVHPGDLCNKGLQKSKVETSWVTKVGVGPGLDLDTAVKKLDSNRARARQEAQSKFVDFPLVDDYVLMVPQELHGATYAEECLPQYGPNRFLGYWEGKPVVSALVQNQRAIWACYAAKNTLVQAVEEPGQIRFTARLDLNAFCKYARPLSDLLSK